MHLILVTPSVVGIVSPFSQMKRLRVSGIELHV